MFGLYFIRRICWARWVGINKGMYVLNCKGNFVKNGYGFLKRVLYVFIRSATFVKGVHMLNSHPHVCRSAYILIRITLLFMLSMSLACEVGMC